MDRLRRGESVNEERDRRIEQRAVLLVKAGRDWLTAVVEATREIDGDVRPARLVGGRATRAGKASRTAAIDAIPGGLLARQQRSEDNDRERAAEADVVVSGPRLSQSLRAQLVSLLGFDPAKGAGGFAPGKDQVEEDEPARGLDRAGAPRTLAETLALLDNPAVSSDFARQAAVAHALLAADAGESLDAGLQSEFGDRLDVALDDVRVHRDPVSSVIVEALGTRAFAFGRHLFFAPGTYAPTTDAGRSLIAHELAHVAQQPAGDAGAARDVRNVRIGGEGDAYEQNADHAAGALLAGLRPQVSRGAPIAARMDGGGEVNPDSVLRKHIGTSEQKAKEALRNAGAKRPMVERIIRDNFSKDQAEEIIKGAKGGGAAAEKAPAVEAKGGAKAGKTDAKGAGKDAQKKAEGALKGGGKGGDAKPGTGGGGDMAKVVEAFTGELTPADRDLIQTELGEHEAWSAAAQQVGAPWSPQRALYVAEMVGRGFGQGFVTGAGMGIVMGVVGQLAQRFCPIPGVGAIIAGGMAAYGLATRDWKQTGETISNFGQGASQWEVIANSLAAISEILDIVVQVMNVVAGIIGLVSAIMWLVTIITVGVASPLAGTLSAIALGILTVSGVIDNINNLIIQPAIIAFRAMHVMNSEADPREIQGQGAKLSDSASKVGSAVGGYLAGRAVDAGAKGFDRRRYGPGGTPGNRPQGSGQTTAQPQAHGTPDAPHAPAGGAQPHGTPDAPHAQGGAQPQPHADANAPAPPQRPAGMSEAEWHARQEHAQRSWGEKVRFAGAKIRDHHNVYAARERENQQRLADAEDAAFHAKQQQIDEARARAQAEADAAHQRAVDEGRVRGEEAATQKRQQRVDRTNEQHAADRQRAEDMLFEDRNRAARRFDQANADAARARDSQHQQIREDRAALETRHQQAMADAAKITDASQRARAEADANRRYQWDQESLARRQTTADSDYRSARERASADHNRALETSEQTAADRRRWADEAKQRGMDRAEWESDLARRGAERDANRAAGDARDSARRGADRDHAAASAKEPGEAARDARRTAEGDPDPGERIGDYRRPLRTLRGAYNKQREMVDEYSGVDPATGEHRGNRSLAWGDVSSKELDPGFSPGGGPVREAVEDRTKQMFGTDKKPDAQFQADHAKLATGERKNPDYQPPPPGASLAKLDQLKKEWQAALDRQHEAEGASKAMKEQKAAHQANEAPIEGLHGEAKKAIENTAAHEGDVKVKADANVKQTQKQAEAAQKIDEYASNQSKFDAVITPMRGLERFTHLGSRLGVSYFDDMNKSVKKTLGGLENASAAMKKEQANQPAAKAELKAKADAIAQTDAKAMATDASFKQSETGVIKLHQDNTDAVAKAGAAEAEATGQKNQYAAKVASYQQQYSTMAGGLLGWARAHRAARAGEPPHAEVHDGGPPQEQELADGGAPDGGAGGDHADAGAGAPPAGGAHAPAGGAPAGPANAPNAPAAPPAAAAPDAAAPAPTAAPAPPPPPPPPAMDAGVPDAGAPPAAPPAPANARPRDAGP